MVHDPRAPRLAAFATLVAAVFVLLTALNLVFSVVGSPGVSVEEVAALALVPVLLFVASLANKQRVVPELVSSLEHRGAERFEFATSPSSSQVQTEVNPTTASILASILGEQTTSDQVQVNSAMDTLTSGAFGESVQRTMDAIEEADGTSLLDNTIFTYGSGLGDGATHQYSALPVIVAGSGGGSLKAGRHLNLSETTGPVAKVNGKYVNPKQGLPLANLWLTQMQALGLKPERFADSTGVLKSLLI